MFKPSEIKDLRSVCHELGHDLSDEQAIGVGQRIIGFLLNSESGTDWLYSSPGPSLTETEQRALAFIEECAERNVRPTVRAIARAAGLSSSRSGHQLVRKLKGKGALREEMGLS